MDTAAPTNGAIEKYAPVLAVPSPRRARKNNARLTPHPASPISIGKTIVLPSGQVAPRAMANALVHCAGGEPLAASEEQGVRSRDLSSEVVVNRPAEARRSDGQGPSQSDAPDTPPSPVGHESNRPPATIASMPKTMRRSACSLETIQAITATLSCSTLGPELRG